MSWCFEIEIRDEVDKQAMLAFFNDLHIDLNVAIERRESLNATIDRATSSAQDIDFLDVAIDKKGDTLSERSRTISDVEIARDKSLDEVRDEDVIDWDGETEEVGDIDSDEICAENETTDFDFFACRVRICSWSLMLLSNLIECLQRLHVYSSARFAAMRISFSCFNNFFAFCFILLFILNSCFRKW